MPVNQLLKILGIAVFAAASALWLSSALSGFITRGTAESIFWLAFASVVLIALLVLQSFFIRGSGLIAGVSLLEAVAIGVFFAGRMNVWGAGAILAAWLLFAFAMKRGADEVDNNLNLKISSIAGAVVGSVARALAIIITVFYVTYFNFQDPKVFSGLMATATRVVPGFSTEDTVGEFIDKLKDTEAGIGKILPGDFGAKLANIEGAALTEIKNRFAVSLGNLTKTDVSPSDNIVDVLYAGTAGRLGNLPRETRVIVGFIAGFLLYGAVRFLIFLISGAAMIVVFILYAILKASKFFTISLESRNKEVLTL